MCKCCGNPSSVHPSADSWLLEPLCSECIEWFRFWYHMFVVRRCWWMYLDLEQKS